MNCANHPDRERAAFCQNCGKPLCSECTRALGTSIFCEPCFTARTAPGQPPPATPPYTYAPRVKVPGEPDPAIAALLGFIPGVGAMYNGQYAKGFVHLIIFAVLTSLADNGNDIFGLFVAGWIVYMVIEAYHTARARRDGTPLPNPFGLNDLGERLGFGKAWPGSAPTYGPYTANPNPGPSAQDPNAWRYSRLFRRTYRCKPNPSAPPTNPYAPPYTYTYVPPVSHWGAPQDAYPYGAPPIPPVPPVPPMPPYADPNSNVPYQRRVPTGAIWLIGLGVFFLLANSGIFHLRARFFPPLVLIGAGVWVFVRKMTYTGLALENDGTQNYRWRLAHAVNSSFWMVLLGVVWLIDALHILTWSHSWPIYLIALGILLLFKHTMYGGPAPSGYNPYPGYSNPTPPPAPPVTTTDLVPTHDHSESDDRNSNSGDLNSNREGR